VGPKKMVFAARFDDTAISTTRTSQPRCNMELAPLIGIHVGRSKATGGQVQQKSVPPLCRVILVPNMNRDRFAASHDRRNAAHTDRRILAQPVDERLVDPMRHMRFVGRRFVDADHHPALGERRS